MQLNGKKQNGKKGMRKGLNVKQEIIWKKGVEKGVDCKKRIQFEKKTKGVTCREDALG